MEEEELIRKSIQFKCAFMYDIYGIAKEEYNSHNKGEYFVSVDYVFTSIPPKCVKTREPKDEHCVSWCN